MIPIDIALSNHPADRYQLPTDAERAAEKLISKQDVPQTRERLWTLLPVLFRRRAVA